MKVLEVGSLDVRLGGPPQSVSRQMLGLRDNNIDSVCLMKPCHPKYVIDNSLNFVTTNQPSFRMLGYEYIPSINKTLEKLGKFDVAHLQNVWTYMSHYVATYSYHHKIPYVIAPRGSLYKEAMNSKWLKKKVAWYAYEKKDLERAFCIQATCTEEMEGIKALGLNRPVAVIPNPFDISKVTEGNYPQTPYFRIGYLGRLAKRKHVERLFYAIEELRVEHHINNIKLLVIGRDNEKYENYLRTICLRLGLSDRVEFAGFLSGEKLDKAIRTCNLFAFPSDFENWGNVVPDVLSRGIPAITTTGMPWRSLVEEKCGWWIDNTQESLNKAILEAYHMRYEELEEMGKKGRALVSQNFSIKSVGAQLVELYSWILDGGVKPEFVYC